MRRAAYALVFVTACYGQDSYKIVREGSYWTRIDVGIVSVPEGGRIRVITPGRVNSQGENRDDIAYMVKRRVRAANGQVAIRLLSGPPLRYTTHGELVMLTVPAVNERAPAPELELRVPRNLRHASFQVEDGTVSAYDLDGAVSVNAKAGSVVMDRIRSRVAAQTGGGEIRLGRIGGAIRCLSGGGGISIEGAGAEAILETAGGEVFVREAFGPVSANTGGGNIEIQRARSLVTAHTNGGLVEVNQALGMVRANTSGGGIQIGIANGVKCESAAGTIELQSVSGALRASTLMGSIVANIHGARIEDSFLNTSAGDITVFLPSKLSVTVQAENEAAGAIGKIFSEFPEIRTLSSVWSNGRPLQAHGALNGGGPVLKLSAIGGIIYLKRQKTD